VAVVVIALVLVIALSYFYGVDSRVPNDRGWVGGDRS
jgi:hypothetical protein